jgi:hypothetical protein
MRPSLLAALVLFGCEPGSNAARSCAGEAVLECDPYEWAVIEEASLEPSAIPIGDPRARARVRVRATTCGERTPLPLTVQVQVLLGRTDGGPPSSLVQLVSVEAPTAGSGAIDVMIDNPFTLAGGVPPDTNVSLRFVPVIGGCDGDALEIPYRTGSLIRP